MLRYLVAVLAGLLAGGINAIAGGGTLLSFPALLWLGVNPLMANATNTVALVPGSLAEMFGFREELATVERWYFALAVPSLLGGGIGALLLLHTSPRSFRQIVPILILCATLLLASQELISRAIRKFAESHGHARRGWLVFAFGFQFLVGIYGGYFGAGIGILMLAALGIISLTDVHQMNGLKNLLAICINGVAAIYFVIMQAVVWRYALLMAVASIIGGFLAARLAHRVGRKVVRRLVIAIGFAMSIATFFK